MDNGQAQPEHTLEVSAEDIIQSLTDMLAEKDQQIVMLRSALRRAMHGRTPDAG